jgi:quinol monooxygenase YgiN
MIFIVAKFPVRPEYADQWLTLVEDFTAATRAEPGNLFFDWFRDTDDASRYLLVEGFRDGDAGAAHVGSAHFAAAMAALPDWLAAVPDIVNVDVPGEGWSQMSEIALPS